jgi:hypothetical protein
MLINRISPPILVARPSVPYLGRRFSVHVYVEENASGVKIVSEVKATVHDIDY